MSKKLSDDDLRTWVTGSDYCTDQVYDQVRMVPRLYEDITYLANTHSGTVTVNHLLYRIKEEFEAVPPGVDLDAILAWQMIQKNDYGMWMIKIEELSACSQSWQADALLEFVQFARPSASAQACEKAEWLRSGLS